MALPDPYRSRAVLVGIGDYVHADLAAMPAADAGAARLARLLCDPSIWGLPQEHVTVLGRGTTQERILTAARDAALATEDTLVVYFAGHGLRDQGERLHLALAGTDPDYPQIGTLPYRQLRDLIRHAGHRAKHRVTILDCCYSGIAGGMSGSGAPTRDDLATALGERADASAEQRPSSDEDDYGDCVLTSAPPQSRSFVRPGATLPEFTGELVTTLEAGITGVGPMITLERAWLRVRDRMRGRGSPEPQLFTQNNATRHIHFHNRAPHHHGEHSAAAPAPDPGLAGTRSTRDIGDRLEGFATGSDNTLRRIANGPQTRATPDTAPPTAQVTTSPHQHPARTDAIGPDHPDTLTPRGGRPHRVGEAGEHAAAARLYAELVADQTRVLGADHPDTLRARHFHAWALGNAGK
ncbi:caspase, EACC1-associated type [Streptomyces aculeolatus]